MVAVSLAPCCRSRSEFVFCSKSSFLCRSSVNLTSPLETDICFHSEHSPHGCPKMFIRKKILAFLLIWCNTIVYCPWQSFKVHKIDKPAVMCLQDQWAGNRNLRTIVYTICTITGFEGRPSIVDVASEMLRTDKWYLFLFSDCHQCLGRAVSVPLRLQELLQSHSLGYKLILL